MFDWIKYRWNLNRLYAKQNKELKPFVKLRKKATPKELETLHYEESCIYFEFQDEIDRLISRYFNRTANKLLIPVPDFHNEEYWSKSYIDGTYILNMKGVWEVKKLIHQDKKGRREGFIIWISSLTGIIGATTGLVAVMSR